MITYTLCTLAFIAGLAGAVYFGQVCLDRTVLWNDRRRERALRYRNRRAR